MTSLQQQIQLYHAIETVLRGAADTSQVMTLGDIYEVSSVRGCSKSLTQVRDKLKVLLKHKLIRRIPVAESMSGNKMAKVGYLWNDESKSTDGTLFQRLEGHPKAPKQTHAEPPRKEPPRKEARKGPPSERVQIEFNGLTMHVGSNVDMYIDGIRCKVDKNPETNLVRIRLE